MRFDPAKFGDALQNYAIPVLEAVAANENYRNRTLRRFERDGPPRYRSSTESLAHDDDCHRPLQEGPLLEELRAIMNRPIDDIELDGIAFDLISLATPSPLYYTEVKREEYRLNRYRPSKVTIFRGNKGNRRLGVMARHNVKRRWEKLGIWNPEWGFPGRNVQPGDNINRWKWRWDQHHADDSGSGDLATATVRQLVACALRQRQNLPRGENAPVIPRSHLKQDVTASEAGSFIISRPWFIFQLELAEEGIRIRRISPNDGRRLPATERGQVTKRWKERGDWREEFNRTMGVSSWKWRHESPSPEPEDLTPLDNMKDSPLDIPDMDLTPSEIDDLETIELSSPEQPENYWAITNEWALQTFPGQRLDLAKKAENLLRQRAEEVARGDRASPKGYSAQFPRYCSPQQEVSSEENEDTVQELKENTSQAQQDTGSLFIHSPLQNSPCQHERQLQDQEVRSQDPDPDRPPLRRSARIASIKRLAEPLLSQTVPNKKHRGRTALNAEAPTVQPASREIRDTKTKTVSARLPAKEETATRRGRGRRRPTKENWAFIPPKWSFAIQTCSKQANTRI